MKFLLSMATAVALSVLLLAPVPASAATTHDATSVQAADGRVLESAGWHGRPIRHPHQHTDQIAATADQTVSGIRRGTGYRTSGGSQRVRTIQRRLQQLGYRPGRVDGRFGPRTESALRWFEQKHGIETAESDAVAAATLTHLRDRATGETAVSTSAPQPERTLQSPQARAQAPATGDDGGARPHADDALDSGILVALVLLGAAAFVVGFMRASSRERRTGPVATPTRPLTAADIGGARRPAGPRPTARPATRPKEEIRP